MLVYPEIDPVALEIGPLKIYWYGISYLLGFLVSYVILFYRQKIAVPAWQQHQVLDLFFYVALGVIIGGRFGYSLVYDFPSVWENPLTALAFWERGRSFHGGLLGVLLAVWLFAVVHQRRFLDVCDFFAPVIPVGLAFGRLGNFINGELWGRASDVPWAMVFPHAGYVARHPSQLYEFLFEGVVLFILLLKYSAKPRLSGRVSGMFLLWYGVFRFIVEFLREPDLDQGFVFLEVFTMGQMLSVPMVLFGMYFLYRQVKS